MTTSGGGSKCEYLRNYLKYIYPIEKFKNEKQDSAERNVSPLKQNSILSEKLQDHKTKFDFFDDDFNFNFS